MINSGSRLGSGQRRRTGRVLTGGWHPSHSETASINIWTLRYQLVQMITPAKKLLYFGPCSLIRPFTRTFFKEIMVDKLKITKSVLMFDLQHDGVSPGQPSSSPVNVNIPPISVSQIQLLQSARSSSRLLETKEEFELLWRFIHTEKRISFVTGDLNVQGFVRDLNMPSYDLDILCFLSDKCRILSLLWVNFKENTEWDFPRC